ISSDGFSSLPVSSFSTARRKSSFGRNALCATRLHNRSRSIIFKVRSVCGKVRNLGGDVLEKQARITSKGQITVPREVRRVLGVRPGDKLLFESDENGVRVRPVRTKSPFAKFKGIGNPGIGSGREGIIRWVREMRG